MATCLNISRLTKRFGGKLAVADLSLEVETGEVVGLLGPNGAGKSTTLYMLSGLVHPSSGTISIFGKELRRNWLEIAPRIGVVVERPYFPRHLNVRRAMKLHARLAGTEVNVDRVLDLAGLLPEGKTRVGSLSQGMRQRLALASAFLTEPRLLLLDEPTSGLDPEAAAELLSWLRRVADEARVTILFSTHVMQEVEILCDRVAVLQKGRLVALEKTDALVSYDTHHVEVMLEGAEGAAKRLNDAPWVEQVQVRPGRLVVRLREAGPAQLNTFLVNAGYHVMSLQPRRRTLQEYFLRVTNRDEESTS